MGSDSLFKPDFRSGYTAAKERHSLLHNHNVKGWAGLGWVGAEVGVEIMRELHIPHIHYRYARSDKRSSISSEEVGQEEDV